MQPEFWLERWRNGQTGFHQPQANPHLCQWWPRLQLPAAARVFVPLCGKSLDLLWLAERGHPVVGVELSALAVEAFFAENGLRPERTQVGPFIQWHCGAIRLLQGDLFDLDPALLGPVEALYDRASLVALPPAMRRAYARHMAGLVPTGAHGLLVTMVYPAEQMTGPPFSVTEEEVLQLYGQDWDVDCCCEVDILAEHPGFREAGLTRLEERVYRLRRGPP